MKIKLQVQFNRIRIFKIRIFVICYWRI